MGSVVQGKHLNVDHRRIDSQTYFLMHVYSEKRSDNNCPLCCFFFNVLNFRKDNYNLSHS